MQPDLYPVFGAGFSIRGVGLAVENSHLDRFTLLETPRFSTNGLMLDCSRNAVASLPTLKTLIRQLALMGHNTLMLYTEDTYTVEGQPYFGYMRGRYTETELRELDEYASSFGIELVPCIQTLAHLQSALQWDAYRDIRDIDDILLADDERTYALIADMIGACRRLFRAGASISAWTRPPIWAGAGTGTYTARRTASP